ncbi:protein seele [Schistocerca americana]|nr:protein seele [Schistocerca americana]XP_047104248.1 protein seele [Schistocerca piceifrons]XP_047104249.1 protein seele [Schistocerca piceifrons]XP_047104250.1 protein seele [Schistocerca piceifrons]XP_049783441.1 protein seele [Schistocerca cancellata]XP_049783442.1 protein seele [Schistocerca cancellata]XP_049804755.1 protein seele-like [Schistocerca nitens]XP_049804756.1 protein seele-like [Schistocerca nitens]XP_049804757.1 protein seele-like [Schistocerca nitens]XP_049804758.1 pro
MAQMRFLLIVVFALACSASHDPHILRCLVCQKLVEEIEFEVQKVDPRKKVDVGSYRIDANGNQDQRAVPYARSELHLTEVLETICNKMDDYVRATYKSSGELTVLKLITNDGKLNEDMGKVDVIQDSDLNRSLKFYCEGIVEENEEAIVRLFSQKEDDIDIKLCTESAKLCSITLEKEQELSENDEL